MKNIVNKENLTNPERNENPISFDIMRYYYSDGCIIEKQIYIPTEQDILGLKEGEARDWRNSELKKTDFIIQIADYPNYSDWLTYRENLRNWPETDNFPETKPTAPTELQKVED